MIENTARRPNDFHLIGLLAQGQSDYITGMEAAGQRQLVHSDLMPSDLSGEQDAFEALGFTFGDLVDNDPLFRHTTLPEGWSKQGSDHDMWSYVVDALGRRRVAVFYKAAYYDRKAFARLNTLSSYVYGVAFDGEQLITDDTWATPVAVAEVAGQYRDRCIRDVEDCGRRAGGDSEPAYWASRAVECRAEAAKFEALLDSLQT